MVRQAQRGEEPSSGRLSTRLTSHGGTMQHVSSDVLQKLQQQGEGQEEEGVERGHKIGRRDHPGDGGPSETSQTSLLLASEDSADSTTSSSPSHLSEAARHSRFPRPEVQGRGCRGYSETRSDSQAPLALSSSVGPTARSRKTTAPSWPRASGTIPSQLLGRGAGTDADVLNPEAAHDADVMVETEITPRPLSVPEHARLYPLRTARLETDFFSIEPASRNSSPPKTPRSAHSIPSISTPSSSSGRSGASSFAYLVRDRREDRRLLQKKYQPLQHRKRRTSPIEQPPSIPAAFLHKSEAAERTAPSVQPASSPSKSTSPSKSVPTPSSSSSHQTVVTKNRSLQSQSQSRSGSSKESSLSPTHGLNRHSRSLSPPSYINIPPQPRYARFDIPLEPQSHGGAPFPAYRYATPTPGSPKTPSRRRSHRPTPPEAEPRTPPDRMPRHGDHYFRIFGSETTYRREFAERGPLEQAPNAKALRNADIDEVTPLPSNSPWDSPTPTRRSHIRNSLFNIFHLGSKNDTTGEEPDHGVSRMSSPSQTPSDVKVGTPLLSKGSRNPSHELFSSYFPNHRRHVRSSDNFSGPSAFALPTNWEDAVSESHAHCHFKQDSAPMSPSSMPQHPTRPKPKRMDERTDVAQATRQVSPDTVSPITVADDIMAPKSQFKSVDAGQPSRQTLAGPHAPSWLPSEMKRINTPPSEQVNLATNKSGGFKSFFFDMKSIPVEQTSTESSSPEPSRFRRRKRIMPRASLQSLLPKLSLNKLKRKATFTNDEPKQAEDPLKVTDFQQTPFSQRYGDTRRTKMSRIRSYLDETLKVSEDDDDTALFAFDAPDHLPNSPLCPLSPKHSSGGKAICPIHSRKKTLVGPASGTTMQRQGKPSPRIVFESGNQAGGRVEG